MKTNFESKSGQLEYKLESKDSGEDHVHNIQSFSVACRLSMKFHGQCYSVDQDENKDGVLKWLRRHEPPDFVLEPIFWNVATSGFSFQSEFYTVPLQEYVTRFHSSITLY